MWHFLLVQCKGEIFLAKQNGHVTLCHSNIEIILVWLAPHISTYTIISITAHISTPFGNDDWLMLSKDFNLERTFYTETHNAAVSSLHWESERMRERRETVLAFTMQDVLRWIMKNQTSTLTNSHMPLV